MEYKPIVIVNENDEVIGEKNLCEAIKDNNLRRVVRIFVQNEQGEYLLQKRSVHVFMPGLFDVSAGGHVDSNETYAAAAARELHEELAIVIPVPDPLITSYRNQTEASFCTFYVVQIPSSQVITFNADEIESVIWKSKQAIETQLKNEPQHYTPAFIESWALLHAPPLPA